MSSGRTIAAAAWIAAGVLALGAWQPVEQSQRLTARELFYAQPASATKAKPPQRKASPKAPAAVTPAPAAVTPPSAAVTPAPAAVTPAPTAAAAGRDRSRRTPGGAQVIPAVATAAKPLGLRYSLLRQAEGGVYRETGADTVFRSGDRIRVSVEANDDAYLYIVMKGASGTWNVLFPNPEISAGSNQVASGRQYLIPPAPGRFAFDEQAGDEQLFIVLSRRPESKLEELIYSLGSGKAPPSEQAPQKVLLSQNIPPIDDGLVGRLRNTVLARDLVFEKVDEAAPGQPAEKAVYIVNPTGAADARLIADLVLKHR